jgi:hypothetical protein
MLSLDFNTNTFNNISFISWSRCREKITEQDTDTLLFILYVTISMYNDKELIHDKGNNLILYIKNVVRSNLACKDQLITFYILLNATFNIISVISWRSIVFVEATGVPGEHHRPVARH